VDKWTRIYVFHRFSLSAFTTEYKVFFISEYLTAFYACSSIIRSILETTMRLSIWSVSHWLPREIKIMLNSFCRRFYWGVILPDSHWLSKFFGRYRFLRWLCVGTTKICYEKLECKKTPFCSALERWESHHHASKINRTQLSLIKKYVECINIWLCNKRFFMLLLDERL
jgi:hypothetical protein